MLRRTSIEECIENRLPVSGLRLKRTLYMIRHADKYVSPVIRAFLDSLRFGVG